MSLQYLQKNVRGKVYFLPVDEHKGFLKVDGTTLDVGSQTGSKYPK